jgi:hypothetical protein
VYHLFYQETEAQQQRRLEIKKIMEQKAEQNKENEKYSHAFTTLSFSNMNSRGSKSFSNLSQNDNQQISKTSSSSHVPTTASTSEFIIKPTTSRLSYSAIYQQASISSTKATIPSTSNVVAPSSPISTSPTSKPTQPPKRTSGNRKSLIAPSYRVLADRKK